MRLLAAHIQPYVAAQPRMDKGKVKHTDEQATISVIITARGECHFLRENLEDILRQDYPRFEVIVINEGLHDESEDFLQQMANRYPHLYHSFVPPTSKYVSRKKWLSLWASKPASTIG